MTKCLRFVSVGIANALVYALSTGVYAHIFAFSATLASGLGYATALPLAFIAHRKFTFKADGSITPQLARFLGNHFLGFSLALIIPWLITDLLNWPIWMGMGATVLLVPVISYLLMDNWVFARP